MKIKVVGITVHMSKTISNIIYVKKHFYPNEVEKRKMASKLKNAGWYALGTIPPNYDKEKVRNHMENRKGHYVELASPLCGTFENIYMSQGYDKNGDLINSLRDLIKHHQGKN